jgi:gliding motility-associated-like protein
MKKICIICCMLTGFVSFVCAAHFSVIKSKVYPKIITPNGDGKNDLFWVFYENPMDDAVQGRIFDVRGAEVADMVHVNGAEEYSLTWDGKDGSGRVVPAGIYLYQIESEGTVYTGSVVVAR